jgi:hypothetical protein
MPDEYKIMTQQRAGVNLVQHIPCRLYPVSIPIDLMVQGSIPVDIFDLYTDYITLTIQRSDYFIDEATNAKYSVYGRPQAYTSHLWCRVTIPTGVTP